MVSFHHRSRSFRGSKFGGLGAFRSGILRTALAIVRDRKLCMRLSKGRIGGDRFLVPRNRVGDLPAQQQLVARIQGEIALSAG